ncbi:MAG: hypothetical protein IM674_00680, partial [Brevundimonas sp.]|nr:hypothetical protein [Brevundimonas sp.]
MVSAVTTDWSAPYAQAQADMARGDMARAFAVLAPAQTDVTAPLPVVRLLASALRALRRNRDARPVLEQLTRLQPDSAIAEHNLAAALGDMGDAVAAEAAARRALTKGGDAPET